MCIDGGSHNHFSRLLFQVCHSIYSKSAETKHSTGAALGIIGRQFGVGYHSVLVLAS